MRKLLFLIIPLLLLGINLQAQDTDRKLTKAERKAQRAGERLASHEALLQLVRDTQFVVEANIIRGRYGRPLPVNPSTNFVAVSGKDATMQLALNNFRNGFNGLGGITLDSQITRYDITNRGPNKGITLHITLFGSAIGNAELFIDLFGDNQANIRVSTIRGGRFQYSGYVVPLEKSIVYKGFTTF